MVQQIEKTMEIILTRTKCFIGGGNTLTVSPRAGAQTVPDWVRDTPTFQTGAKDGSVMEVKIVSASAPAPLTETPDAEPEPVATPAPRPLQPPGFQGRRR